MLADSTVLAMVAVSDYEKGLVFYRDTLGLRLDGEMPGTAAFKCGQGTLIMYPAPSAGHNQATSATWDVRDIEAAVAELKDKGITFESYDIPGATKEGDIYSMMDGKMKAAWFKDPDGNILALASS
jgi:catechol 2,3-dioxygenase-like lactoylglutathione lyase family enzyme